MAQYGSQQYSQQQGYQHDNSAPQAQPVVYMQPYQPDNGSQLQQEESLSLILYVTYFVTAPQCLTIYLKTACCWASWCT